MTDKIESYYNSDNKTFNIIDMNNGKKNIIKCNISDCIGLYNELEKFLMKVGAINKQRIKIE